MELKKIQKYKKLMEQLIDILANHSYVCKTSRHR
jgi:hypothetical protein